VCVCVCVCRWKWLTLLPCNKLAGRLIREDIVYNKHSGEMIGFANFGEIKEHLMAFKKAFAAPVTS